MTGTNVVDEIDKTLVLDEISPFKMKIIIYYWHLTNQLPQMIRFPSVCSTRATLIITKVRIQNCIEIHDKTEIFLRIITLTCSK